MNEQPFIVDMTADEYNEAAKRGDWLTSQLLADFRECPLLYKQEITEGVEAPDSDMRRLDRDIHTLVLEGREKFEMEHTISAKPIDPKTGEPATRWSKCYKEWRESLPHPLVLDTEFAKLERLRESVWSHPVAKALLANGRANGVIRCDVYCGLPCQCRMDWFNPDYNGKPVIVELKTTDRIGLFDSTARNRGYIDELAFAYALHFLASDGVFPDAYLIAIEKSAPHRCGVWQVDEALLDQTVENNEANLDWLRECRKRDIWPTNYEEMRILEEIDND